MADEQIYQSRDSGSLWIQPDGPGTKLYYLPCHDLEDLEETKGSITLIQCIDELGRYKTIGATEDPPEPVTTEISTYIGPVADWLERVMDKCPFGLYINLRCGGRAGVFENWERTYVIETKKITSVTRSGLVRKDEDVVAMHTFGIEALPGVLSFVRLTTASTQLATGAAVSSIKFWDTAQCWGKCGETFGNCDYGVAVTKADTGSASSLGQVFIYSPDNAFTWTATATDPFAATEDISDVVLFDVGLRLPRILVSRGTTDGANPAEIAYTDDEGATWTNVDVGSVNGQYGVKRGALNVVSRYDVWFVTDDGYIYQSEDGGATWTARDSGTLTSGAWNYVEFSDPQNGWVAGDSSRLARTFDGGKTWSLVTLALGGSADYRSLAVIDKNRLYVGGDVDSEIFLTTNAGISWTIQKVAVGTTNHVDDMHFRDAYFGVSVIGSGAGIGTYVTVNGGWTWEKQTDSVASQGHNAVWACDTTNVWWGTGTTVLGNVVLSSI